MSDPNPIVPGTTSFPAAAEALNILLKFAEVMGFTSADDTDVEIRDKLEAILALNIGSIAGLADALAAKLAADAATAIALISSVAAEARLDESAVKGFDTAPHGELVLQALAGSLTPSARQFLRRNAANTGWEMKALGTAAELDAVPPGAPPTASSASGAVTLDFEVTDRIETATTEDITAVTLSNLPAYSTGLWRVKHTTARNITFPSGWKIGGNAGALLYPGVANSTTDILIYNDNGTIEVVICDSAVVGA